ncbi:Group 3 truncated hemoglobin ctb [Maliponia aquimaris]|uniref:Group 3 truncated hemoglobin ctb n=2 Tax=Maliponia aquimaris TaxID=1673631 RepID=A0A238L1U3_9RHOB|nr:Group 3 truncated hemoglobin ctb [Maliponia aquimaris]
MSSAGPEIPSARPDLTAEIMAQTGLNGAKLIELVNGVYDHMRADPKLGPNFDARISDRGPHQQRMVAFWSSVALMTGRDHGSPIPAHTVLPVTRDLFGRWLAPFRKTAHDVCAPEGAAHVIVRAERIARSLHMAVANAKPGNAPSLS